MPEILPITGNAGDNVDALSLRASLRAGFGQFILGDGIGNSQRILPSGWVEEASQTSFQLDPSQHSYGTGGYGYSWWLDTDGSMVAIGFAGQSTYINRRENLVIATCLRLATNSLRRRLQYRPRGRARRRLAFGPRLVAHLCA